MSGKQWQHFRVISMLIVIAAFICCIVGESPDSFTLWIKLALMGIVSAVFLSMFMASSENLYRFVSEMESQLDITERDSLHKFPAAAVIIDKADKIIWYNRAFDKLMSETENDEEKEIFGIPITDIMDIDLEETRTNKESIIEYKSGHYRVKAVTTEKSDTENRPITDLTMLYIEDMSELYDLQDSFKKRKTWVMYLLIDSYDDLFANIRETDKAQILLQIDKLVEEFIEKTDGIHRKVAPDRYIAIVGEQSVAELINEQFRTLLEKARSIYVTDKSYVTVSIGVGRGGKTIAESDALARQALDLTQGRGGDQAAVRDDRDFMFFGGTSKGIEKQTRVRIRVFSSSLLIYAEKSDVIFVMGHKFSDLDSVGSAVGLTAALRILGFRAYVCVDEKHSLATPLIERIRENAYDGNDIFRSPEETLEIMNDPSVSKSLLVAVDTNTTDRLDSTEVYQRADDVFCIDHHRQGREPINNAISTVQETYASSASEIVTEIIQCLPMPEQLSSYYAEAILSGIMLDTKDFVNKTGVRTFEAAAYLKKLGADTVAVKLMFADSLECCKKRSKIIESAEIYNRCAISVWRDEDPDIRIFSAQAADALLGVENVAASFVLYPVTEPTRKYINVSARSYGYINVQMVMEQLGGGGHLTMAAAQIGDKTVDEAVEILKGIIDEHLRQTTLNTETIN